ncbi:acyl carrier protein [Streptomyces sp. NPDC004059]|uniref:acyl carrier protein n=1 Tax=Streptomyces sp. NPDC051896 TaxID=3155416 RepID=UPI0034185E6A
MTPSSLNAPKSLEETTSWLIGRVAYYVRLPAEEVAVDVPLADYGLDSVYAFSLSADIEDEFGVTADPTLLWDFETVAALAEYLVNGGGHA